MQVSRRRGSMCRAARGQRPSSLAYPNPEYLVVTRAARELVDHLPAKQGFIVYRGSLTVALYRDTARHWRGKLRPEIQSAVVGKHRAHSNRKMVCLHAAVAADTLDLL